MTTTSRRLPAIAAFVLAASFVVGGAGGAVSARLITGKDIKDNTVSSRDIKNGTIKPRDLAAGTAISGPRGPQGAPGTATAYGSVNGFNTPFFEAKSDNVVAITRRPGYTGGAYCISFTTPIPQSRLASAVASNARYGRNVMAVNWLGCPAGQLAIIAMDDSDAFQDSVFTFIVP